ncbi:unnamed protein product [Closterium sp. NIES-54]
MKHKQEIVSPNLAILALLRYYVLDSRTTQFYSRWRTRDGDVGEGEAHVDVDAGTRATCSVAWGSWKRKQAQGVRKKGGEEKVPTLVKRGGRAAVMVGGGAMVASAAGSSLLEYQVSFSDVSYFPKPSEGNPPNDFLTPTTAVTRELGSREKGPGSREGETGRREGETGIQEGVLGSGKDKQGGGKGSASDEGEMGSREGERQRWGGNGVAGRGIGVVAWKNAEARRGDGEREGGLGSRFDALVGSHEGKRGGGKGSGEQEGEMEWQEGETGRREGW